MQNLKKIDIPPSRITSAFSWLLGLGALGWAGTHSIYSGAWRGAETGVAWFDGELPRGIVLLPGLRAVLTAFARDFTCTAMCLL